jgi:glutaredoxin-related protein
MNNIFEEKNIYPHEGKIKDHFRDFYDSVYVAYFPFFRIENHLSKNNNYKKSEKITFEDAKKELDILNNIIELNAEIFSYSNEDYPTNTQIYNHGKIVSWKTIIKEICLKDQTDLNKTLRTSIGAIRPIFQKPEFNDKLNIYTTKNSIWHPTEGSFDVFSKIKIYRIFKLFNKEEILFVDEFYENITSININELTEYEFSEKVGNNDYYIYSLDKEILFTIEWDSFFFLIATDKAKMEIIISENYFEGFLCDSETTHNWDYLNGEVERLLKDEKNLNVTTENKKWWKFWT